MIIIKYHSEAGVRFVREQEKPDIRRLPLFRDMATANFETLMQVAYSQNFPPQLDLLRQGEPADFLHIVVEGMVELRAEWGGRETTMAVVGPISTFVLAACIKDTAYLMSARTLEKSRIVMVPAVDLRAAFRRDPDFAMAVIVDLAGSYRSMVRHAKNLKLRNSRERLAAFVLRQSALNGQAPGFVLPVEKRLLASYLGMTPENLSRTMRQLESEGLKVDGQRLIITDRAALTALAQPDPLIDGPDTELTAEELGLPRANAVG